MLLRGLAVKVVAALILLNFAMDTLDLFSIDGQEDEDERILLSAEDMFDSNGTVADIDSFPGDRLTKKEKESLLVQVHKEEKERKRRIQMLEMEKPVEKDEPFKIVDTSSWAKPSSTYVVDTRDLWEHDELDLPQWMINYFRWNKEFLVGSDWGTTTTELPNGHKFLYVTCLKDYPKCGGTADRLSSLPFLVKVAASSQRHILFQWTRPASLESFLLPPLFGVDWRVPATKEEALQKVGYKVGTEDTILEGGNTAVLQVKFQSHDHGSRYYNSIRESDEEPKYKDVFQSVWNIFFTPSRPLALEIEKTMAKLGLVPGGYSSAHVRALYDSKTHPNHLVGVWAKNAVNCAYYLQYRGNNPLPIYFASDSSLATSQATLYGSASGVTVLAYQNSATGTEDPLHLDKAADWETKQPSDFFDVFVDLYMMSMGVGVTHGLGGFGVFASLLSNNVTNVVRHMSAANPFACPTLPRKLRKRRGMRKYQFKKEEPNSEDDEPLFFPPMPELKGAGAAKLKLQKKKTKNSPGDVLFPDFAKPIESKIWESSSRMPKWMKDYFSWHREQMDQVKSTNYLKFKFLVITCFRDSNSCGNLEERLRPIPFYTLIAAQSQRILLISWEKPAPLEEFLLPPRGGVDWRTPSYMMETLRNKGQTATSVKQLQKFAHGTERIVKSALFGHNTGSNYYNVHAFSSGHDAASDPFRYEYRDCWFSLFTPVRKIVRMVEYELESLDLFPKRFAVAHFEAKYTMNDVGRDVALVANWTRNSLNCASNVAPDQPLLFVSDYEDAKSIAKDYGSDKNAVIVARMNSKSYEYVGLDDKGWENRRPMEFYPLFVDLYLMSLASCYSYNVGVFAKWANHISGENFDCSVRHWTPGVDSNYANRNGCTWTGKSQTESGTTHHHKTGRKAGDLFTHAVAHEQ